MWRGRAAGGVRGTRQDTIDIGRAAAADRAALVALVAVILLVVGGVQAAAARFQVEYEPSTVAPADPLDGYDPYGRSDSVHAGTRSEVCVSSLPPGTAAFLAWVGRWPGVERAQVLSCRLIGPRPGGGSRDVPPGDETFYETWSSHATGRGLDLFASRAAGDRLVDYLLAGHEGAPHVVARRLGVLQIIWDGACWEAREEQSRLSIHSAADMRAQYPCAAGASHRDHIHLTLDLAGAGGTASGYALLGPTPPPVLPPAFFVRGATHFQRSS